MPCTPAVHILLAEEMRVQVREGGKGKAGGVRVSSSCSNSSSGRSNLSTVAAGVELHSLAPNIVGMPRRPGTFGMAQVPCRLGQVGKFPQRVGYLLIHRRQLCHRCRHRRRVGALHLEVRIGAGGVATDAINPAIMSKSAQPLPRI